MRPTGNRFVSCVRARGLVVRWEWSENLGRCLSLCPLAQASFPFPFPWFELLVVSENEMESK